MENQNLVHSYNGICNEIWAILMDLEGIMLKKMSQMEKNTYCKITLICGIEKHQTDQKQTH